MATGKFSKDDLVTIIRRITKQRTLADIRTEIDDIADEYNLDLDETEELDVDSDRDILDDEIVDSDYYENGDNDQDDWE